MFYIKIINLYNKFDTNDFLSKNDLYVTINYNGYKRDTSIKYNTDLPTWNEEFLFRINYSIDTFIIEIKDKNMSSDKLLLKQIVHVNYHDLKDLYIDNKLCIQFGDIFYKKDYEINSLNNKIVDLEKVNDNLKKNNNILTEKIENIKKIAN